MSIVVAPCRTVVPPPLSNVPPVKVAAPASVSVPLPSTVEPSPWEKALWTTILLLLSSSSPSSTLTMPPKMIALGPVAVLLGPSPGIFASANAPLPKFTVPPAATAKAVALDVPPPAKVSAAPFATDIAPAFAFVLVKLASNSSVPSFTDSMPAWIVWHLILLTPPRPCPFEPVPLALVVSAPVLSSIPSLFRDAPDAPVIPPSPSKLTVPFTRLVSCRLPS